MPDEEEYHAKLSSDGQKADLQEEAALAGQVSSVSKAIDVYTEYGTELAHKNQDSRKKMLESMEHEQRRIDDEKIFLSNLAIQVSEGREATELGVAKVCKGIISFEGREKPLEEVVNGWFRQSIMAKPTEFEKLLFPKDPPKTVYTAHLASFVPYDWEMVLKHLNNEVADRSIVAGGMETKIIPLRFIVLKEDFFLSQPNKYVISQFERELEQYGLQRAAVRARIARRLQIFQENIGLYRDLAAKEGLEGKEAEVMAEALASQKADELLKEEEEKQSQTKDQVERIPVSSRQSDSERLTASQHDERVRVERSAELNRGNFSVREMVQHPSIFINKTVASIKDYFKKFFGKKEVAQKVAGETVAKAGVKGLATKVGLGAVSGGVLTAVMFAKELLANHQLQETLKNLLSRGLIAASLVFYFLLSHPLALIMGGVGSLLLSPLISILGPLAPMGGFAAGFALGLQIESIIGGIFQGAGAATATATTAVTTTTTASTAGAVITGTGAASIGFWSIGAGAGAVLATSIFSLIALFAVGAIQGQEVSGGPKISFSVKSEVDKKVLPNDSNSVVKYRVIITSQSDTDMEISAVVKETLQNANNTNLISPQNIDSYPAKITPGEKIIINYQDYPVKDTFNDSDLVFIVTVISGAETETASSITRIGSPPVNNDRPFGYPSGGQISRFEDNPDHRGTFFNSSGSRYWATGGIDIVNVGGTPVYSTVNGPVIYSGFDYGKSIYSEKNCVSPISVVSPFNYCAVGGAVIVQSGNYIVSFLHLRQIGLATETVAKGQIIGYMYDNPLPTSDTSHLHYQVLLNGANIPFGGEANDSSAPCTPEKILPEIASRKTINQDGSGPFTCD